tara:strand:+ start:1522 stop:1878 length:357 start_codon:yes stop_codon:yes gene_type:complete
MKYIFYKKKLINGKKRRIYKKKGSKKLYLKHKGRMVNVVKYKKYLKRKQKGGNETAWQMAKRATNAAQRKVIQIQDNRADIARENRRNKRRAEVVKGRNWAQTRDGRQAQQWAPRRRA